MIGLAIDLIDDGCAARVGKAKLASMALGEIGPLTPWLVKEFAAAVNDCACAWQAVRDGLASQRTAFAPGDCPGEFAALHAPYDALLSAALCETRCAELQRSAALHALSAAGSARHA